MNIFFRFKLTLIEMLRHYLLFKNYFEDKNIL